MFGTHAFPVVFVFFGRFDCGTNAPVLALDVRAGIVLDSGLALEASKGHGAITYFTRV